MSARWTVDYGDGPRPCSLPHAWRQDVPVTWEGPARYQAELTLGPGRHWLLVHGASYAVQVFVDGVAVCSHTGIWDAFAVDLGEGPRTTTVEIQCTKNGGETYPVRSCLSGFIPYVFHTFGGLWGGADVVQSESDPTAIPKVSAPARVRIEGTSLFIEERPTYIKGALHWGWYPEIGHPNPPEGVIREEARLLKGWGFNTVKCCLWVPPRSWLEIMREEGLWVWLELPLWDPDPANFSAMREEIERIVLQRRDFDHVIAWTVGCELGERLTSEQRRELVQKVKSLTGAVLVKDSSGGSEMYGGDVREYGSFDDFHPYCDLPFYPPVLESLMPGPREGKPVLLGEFCDHDAYRELAPLASERPYWASSDPALNAQGVRWQYDLPDAINRAGETPPSRRDLRERSIRMSRYVRQRTMEAVRSQKDVAGWVMTGWRDTPISTSGFVDDDLEPIHPEEAFEWNAPEFPFLIPHRKPPWRKGGNRGGWLDPRCWLVGNAVFQIGMSSERGIATEYPWSLSRGEEILVEGSVTARMEAGQSKLVAELSGALPQPGEYSLQLGNWRWRVLAFDPLGADEFREWRLHDPGNILEGLSVGDGPNLIVCAADIRTFSLSRQGRHVVAILDREGCIEAPGWRECVLDGPAPFVDDLDWYYTISSDCALDPDWLAKRFPDGYEALATRVDTRTYRELPLLVHGRVGNGSLTVTSLRPHGGLGAQPPNIVNNPGGIEFLRYLCALATKSGRTGA